MCARPLNLHRYSSSSDSLCRLPRRLRTLAGDAESLSAAGSATPACEAPPGPPPHDDAPMARGRSSRILSIELSSSSLARARRREEHEGQYLRTATRTTISAGQGLHMR